MTNFSIIVATDLECGIGKGGVMPWHLPGELGHFAEITTTTEDPDKQNAVIMGRVTWESIPEEHRPLKNRLNIILTRQDDYELPEGVHLSHSLKEALALTSDCEKVFVIGGGRVYHEAIQMPECETIYRTVIEEDFDCDTFFPNIYDTEYEFESESDTIEEAGTKYKFLTYTRK